jgi:multiple sugar transport system substrate-binding protein
MMTALVALVIVAILISAGTLYYAMSIMGQFPPLTEGLAELTTAERELATEMAKLGETVGESVAAIEDIEERLATVEEALKPPPVPKEVLFLSTQYVPITEAEWARTVLLPPFEEETGIKAVFVTAPGYGPFVDRLIAEAEAEKVVVDVAGSLHGDFPVLVEKGVLMDLTGMPRLPDRTFIKEFEKLSVMKGIKAYVPWMQATYLVMANKKSLDYFPAGKDMEAMTYDDLLQWAKNIYEATGEKKLGIPAGPKSLLHRWLHGYLYPSFTGKQVEAFKSSEAVKMWEYVQELFEYVHPAYTTYDVMADPLLLEEVWVAWDHTARLLPALRERPGEFIALPSPAGPAGRGFIAVIAGLAIPKGAPNPDLGWKLIDYLTRPETQVAILEGVGFFPVVEEAAGVVPPGPVRIMAEGVTKQAAAPDAIVALLPIGLGGRVGEFTAIYRDAFSAIIVEGRPISEVLEELGELLFKLFEETGAPYPPPG